MSNILEQDSERVKNLLSKNIPSYRQAYSDRTAWVMACMSELAYIKFNPVLPAKDFKSAFVKKLTDIVGEERRTSLDKLIKLIEYDHEAEKKKLEEEIGIFNLQLLGTFDKDGTQAVLISSNKYIILAFRGIEADSIKDIKADLKAHKVGDETGGSIHAGFKEAFKAVHFDIQERLNSDNLKDKPLFITGHSSGGALATIAAKKLSHQGGTAACYTYGSPRVGDDEWVEGIKTPIYRVVNSADCVTMLPPGDSTIQCFAFILKIIAMLRIPLLSRALDSLEKWIRKNFGGYLHTGDMRFLTNCPSGNYEHVRLLSSVSWFYRTKGFFIGKLPWKKLVADHSISIYRKKLMIIAENHNRDGK